MKVRQTMREIVEKTRAREKNNKQIFLIPLIPTLIVTVIAIINTQSWDLIHIILYPFAIVGVYLISVITILDVYFGYSIYEVLSPILKRKVDRFFNTPNRVDRLEQQLQTKNNFLNPNIENILRLIVENYEKLGFKNMGEVFVEIFQRLKALEDKPSNQENQYPCIQCKKPIEMIRPDDVFTVLMRDRCDVCDMLNKPIFRRWSYTCSYCNQINQVMWHHKDGHTMDEIRLAEKMYYESGESD